MRRFGDFIRGLRQEPTIDLKAVKGKFNSLITILDNNNRIHGIIGDMEEKSQGDYLFDVNYIRTSLAAIDRHVGDMIDSMILLGGGKYDTLKERKEEIDASLGGAMPEFDLPREDVFVVSLDKIDRSHARRVGGKNARLGEIKAGLGLPVPDGFAITAWAYTHFMRSNDLEARIDRKIRSLRIQRMEDLQRVSSEIKLMITESPVPGALERDITKAAGLFRKGGQCGLALRSSAIGEDSSLSFAGQYASRLNIQRSGIVACYRDILAGKFTPRAIYYTLSHSLLEQELAMGVGCIRMVDARSSGVIYTRDPIDTADDCLAIHSIFGLGKPLVDGAVNPDITRVSRRNLRVVGRRISPKATRLILERDEGVVTEDVPENERETASISDAEACKLAEYCMQIEERFSEPQDIEWAIDKQGVIFILQSRPLKIVGGKKAAAAFDASGLVPIHAGGVTICPGAGSGPAFLAMTKTDFAKVPDGAVLVTPSASPEVVTAMQRARAIVTCVGNVASHMATLTREYRVPALGNIEGAMSIRTGRIITVDATEGKIYDGFVDGLVSARSLDAGALSDSAILTWLKEVLTRIAPLNLLHPADPNFNINECVTYHDLVHYMHQKALEEMFYGARRLGQSDQIRLRLKTAIPLQINIVYIDRDPEEFEGMAEVPEDEIACEPMTEFWRGVKAEGWPSLVPADPEGAPGVLSTTLTRPGETEFSEKSYAVLGREYMMLAIRMGYHYNSIESICTADPNKNFIRMQYKDGGASLDKRMRRIKIIAALLEEMGFEHSTRGDFLDARIAYRDADSIRRRLHMLGRISVKTKQLDMALSNDAITNWYISEFMKILGLGNNRGAGSDA